MDSDAMMVLLIVLAVWALMFCIGGLLYLLDGSAKADMFRVKPERRTERMTKKDRAMVILAWIILTMPLWSFLLWCAVPWVLSETWAQPALRYAGDATIAAWVASIITWLCVAQRMENERRKRNLNSDEA